MGRILTPNDVAKMTGWSLPKIRTLCASGRLPAVNTSTTEARPRWSIREEDLAEFFTPASKREPATKAKTERRQRIDADVQKVF